MVGSVSSVSNNVAFKAAMDKVTPEMINNPGAYSQAPSPYAGPTQATPKKGSFLGSIFKLAFKAAVVVGAAIAARKYIPALGKEKISGTVLKEGAGKLDKAKHYFAKYTDISEAKIVEVAGKVKKYFTSKPAEAAAANQSVNKVV